MQDERPQEEKLEFLKREEVRTMGRDIARLREEEAAKAREHIVKSAEPQGASAPSKSPPQQEAPVSQPSFAPLAADLLQLPKPQGTKEKLLVRLLFVGIIVLVLVNIGFFAFRSFLRNKTSSEEVQLPSQEEPGELAPEPAPPQQPVSPSFFPVSREVVLEVNPQEDLKAKLKTVLSGEAQGTGFVGLVLKERIQQEQETLIGLAAFLQRANITVPPAVSSILEDKFFLFLYGSQGYTRLGLVAKAKDPQALKEAMGVWETTMEEDTLPLFALIAKAGKGYRSFFKSATYEGKFLVRYQTYATQDFGLCWTQAGQYLILTSSLESMEQVIDELSQ